MSDDPHERFERSYVTARYLMGVRGSDQLLAGLTAPGERAKALARGLGHPEREVRARVLAPEAAVLLQSLQARSLTRALADGGHAPSPSSPPAPPPTGTRA